MLSENKKRSNSKLERHDNANKYIEYCVNISCTNNEVYWQGEMCTQPLWARKFYIFKNITSIKIYFVYLQLFGHFQKICASNS